MFMIFSVPSFGIDFWSVWASIVAPYWIPLASNSMFWGDCFFDNLFELFFFIDCASNWLRQVGGWYLVFSVFVRDLFPHSCTFYCGKTYNCQKPCFSTYFKQLRECIYTCNFYLRKTYKCAVTVFTMIKNKNLMERNRNFVRSKAWFWNKVCVG